MNLHSSSRMYKTTDLPLYWMIYPVGIHPFVCFFYRFCVLCVAVDLVCESKKLRVTATVYSALYQISWKGVNPNTTFIEKRVSSGCDHIPTTLHHFSKKILKRYVIPKTALLQTLCISVVVLTVLIGCRFVVMGWDGMGWGWDVRLLL